MYTGRTSLQIAIRLISPTYVNFYIGILLNRDCRLCRSFIDPPLPLPTNLNNYTRSGKPLRMSVIGGMSLYIYRLWWVKVQLQLAHFRRFFYAPPPIRHSSASPIVGKCVVAPTHFRFIVCTVDPGSYGPRPCWPRHNFLFFPDFCHLSSPTSQWI